MVYSGRAHSQNGLPESVDVSGFVFSPVILSDKSVVAFRGVRQGHCQSRSILFELQALATEYRHGARPILPARPGAVS